MPTDERTLPADAPLADRLRAQISNATDAIRATMFDPDGNPRDLSMPAPYATDPEKGRLHDVVRSLAFAQEAASTAADRIDTWEERRKRDRVFADAIKAGATAYMDTFGAGEFASARGAQASTFAQWLRDLAHDLDAGDDAPERPVPHVIPDPSRAKRTRAMHDDSVVRAAAQVFDEDDPTGSFEAGGVVPTGEGDELHPGDVDVGSPDADDVPFDTGSCPLTAGTLRARTMTDCPICGETASAHAAGPDTVENTG